MEEYGYGFGEGILEGIKAYVDKIFNEEDNVIDADSELLSTMFTNPIWLKLPQEVRRYIEGYVDCKIKSNPSTIFWIIRHSHRHGQSVWPVFQEKQPTLEKLLTDGDFATDYEGEGRVDGKMPRDDEYVEIYGQFVVPTKVE
jgi:hypothetical protein